MFLGFVVVAPAFGFMGALIDRIGARRVLRIGILLVALALILMARMTRLWEYYVLCIVEVVGYVLAGPISNQVLISNWFRAKRGRAMGYAYLGLGLGGVAAPVLAAYLIRWTGWRHAFAIIGVLIGVVLFPVAQWLTRSAPGEMGLVADGVEPALRHRQEKARRPHSRWVRRFEPQISGSSSPAARSPSAPSEP